MRSALPSGLTTTQLPSALPALSELGAITGFPLAAVQLGRCKAGGESRLEGSHRVGFAGSGKLFDLGLQIMRFVKKCHVAFQGGG